LRTDQLRAKRFNERKLLLVLAVVAVLTSTFLTDRAAANESQAAPLRLTASVACLDTGLEITFTIENLSRETAVINPDFHLFLTAVQQGGQQPLGALFVFPAPGFNEIPPGEERTFIIPFGDEEPGGGDGSGGEGEGQFSVARRRSGNDADAQRLIIGAEVFLEGRERPVTRHFSFPACD